MPDLHQREGLTVAIYRKTRDSKGNRVQQRDFSCYPIGLTGAVYNDTLAKMIVDSWVDENFKDGLMKNSAERQIVARGTGPPSAESRHDR